MKASGATVFIVDDHPLVITGLNDFFADFPALGRVISSCKTGIDAARQISSSGAALVLLDLALPGLSGWEVLKTLRGGGYKIPGCPFDERALLQRGP